MSTIRWIFFIPAALIAGTLVSGLVRFAAGALFPDIVEFLVCGAFGAATMIIVGLRVAPKRTAAVKWTLIVITALIGGLAALGSLLGPDKPEAAIGVSTLLVAFGFSSKRADNITDARPSGAK
jgi:hypothetical protein